MKRITALASALPLGLGLMLLPAQAQATTTVSSTVGSHDWTWLSSDHARFNPCQAITWKFNQNGGYASSLADVQGAFDRLAKASGLTFGYAGPTSVDPRPGSYDRTATITVGFTTPAQVGSLAGSTAGQGGGAWTTHDGYGEMVRATLVLDRTESLRAGFTRKGSATWGQVMEHEIGHTLGLGHASGRRQLMYGVASSRNHKLGAGDKAGLRSVGLAAGCIPNSARTV
jgi:hypothetical protein